ncbi:FecR family protein [Roseibium sp. MMSF_3544]|uniref:FecR family protein n=1 Tax=unclassified Roseibium TaxID=2629323 RepID=UPI00273E7E6E|nr:FecR family protein [Roseibium sp. MMSF_3544]
MKNFIVFAMFTLLVTFASGSGSAQTLVGCTSTNLGDPPRVVYQCAGGVVLEAEAAAALGVLANGPNERPTDVEVSSDAVLIEIAPGSGPFQIRTPHAIAAVRGTVYAVDVQDGTTSVFVSEGEVTVSRLDGSDQVLLPAGFGVDVSAGEPVVAREWGAERVARLLSRFGR